MQIEFIVTEQTLSDNSKVFNVQEKTGCDFSAPSERTAHALCHSLNDVIKAFENTGSDNAAIRLANAIFEACKNV